MAVCCSARSRQMPTHPTTRRSMAARLRCVRRRHKRAIRFAACRRQSPPAIRFVARHRHWRVPIQRRCAVRRRAARFGSPRPLSRCRPTLVAAVSHRVPALAEAVLHLAPVRQCQCLAAPRRLLAPVRLGVVARRPVCADRRCRRVRVRDDSRRPLRPLRRRRLRRRRCRQRCASRPGVRRVAPTPPQCPTSSRSRRRRASRRLRRCLRRRLRRCRLL